MENIAQENNSSLNITSSASYFFISDEILQMNKYELVGKLIIMVINIALLISTIGIPLGNHCFCLIWSCGNGIPDKLILQIFIYYLVLLIWCSCLIYLSTLIEFWSPISLGIFLVNFLFVIIFTPGCLTFAKVLFMEILK